MTEVHELKGRLQPEHRPFHLGHVGVAGAKIGGKCDKRGRHDNKTQQMQSADVSRARRMENLVCGLEDVRGMESGSTPHFNGCLKLEEVSIADKAFAGVK